VSDVGLLVTIISFFSWYRAYLATITQTLLRIVALSSSCSRVFSYTAYALRSHWDIEYSSTVWSAWDPPGWFVNVHSLTISDISYWSIIYSVYSGVPRILEWDGSRCRRRRGGGAWEGVSSYPLGKGLRRGHNLPHKIFRIFCWKYHIWRLLTCLFLTSYANGRGSNPPLTPFLGTPLTTWLHPAADIGNTLGELLHWCIADVRSYIQCWFAKCMTWNLVQFYLSQKWQI